MCKAILLILTAKTGKFLDIFCRLSYNNFSGKNWKIFSHILPFKLNLCL